jgi:hypothetical protein
MDNYLYPGESGYHSRYDGWIQDGRLRGYSSSPGMQDFFASPCSPVHFWDPVSHPMGTGGSFPSGNSSRRVELTTHLQIPFVLYTVTAVRIQIKQAISLISNNNILGERRADKPPSEPTV